MSYGERRGLFSELEWLIINEGSDCAIELLDSKLINDKDNIDIIFQKAMIYYIDIKLDKALKELDNILKINPKYVDALLLKGEILVGTHNHDEAIKTFYEIHPRILPYGYKKLIEYISDFEYNNTSYYNVFKFNSYFDYVYVDLGIFNKLTDEFLDNLKNKVFRRGLIWIRVDNGLDMEYNSAEYFSYKPLKEKTNIISGIRLSDEEPDNELNNVEIGEYCIVCGKKLTGNQKKLCRMCFKKQYASRIIKKLVSVVQPEVIFKKTDLKTLNLDDIQIQDYIWTLQEFNLIEMDKNKFKLKDKDTLNNFRIDSKMEPIDFNGLDEQNKINKTCKICGKSLSISQFYKSSEGYEDICKICKKHMGTAKYLEDIIDYVGFSNEFDETDLLEYIPNQNQIMGMIWSLQDNDLLLKTESQKYILVDKSKCLTFLDKYDSDYKFNEKNIKVNSKTKTKSRTKEDISVEKQNSLLKLDGTNNRKTKSLTDKQKQMCLVLNACKDGKTREEAANIAEIPLYKINHWYKEGKQGFGEDNVSFYKELQKIDDKLLILSISNERKQMEFVLKLLRKGKSKVEVIKLTELDESILTSWYNQGRENRTENTTYFYKEVQKIRNGDINIENEKIKANDLKVQIKEYIPKFIELDEKISKVDANNPELEDIRKEIKFYIKLSKLSSRLRRVDKLENRLSDVKKSYNVLDNRLNLELKNVENHENKSDLFDFLYSITGYTGLNSSFIYSLESSGLSVNEGNKIKSQIKDEIGRGVLKTSDEVQSRLEELIKQREYNYNELLECLYYHTGKYTLKFSFVSYLESNGLSANDGEDIRKKIKNEITNGMLETCDDVQLRLDELIKQKKTIFELLEFLYSITGNNNLPLKDYFVLHLYSIGLSVNDGEGIRRKIKNEITNGMLETCDDVQLRLDELVKQKQSEHRKVLFEFLYSITGNYLHKCSSMYSFESNTLSVNEVKEIRSKIKDEIKLGLLKTSGEVQLRWDELVKQKQLVYKELLKCLNSITGNNDFYFKKSFISYLEVNGRSIIEGKEVRSQIKDEIRKGLLKTCDEIQLRLNELIKRNMSELLKYLYSITGEVVIYNSFFKEFSTGNLDYNDIKNVRSKIVNEIENHNLEDYSQIRLRLVDLIEQKKQERIHELYIEFNKIVGETNFSESFLTTLSEKELNEKNGDYIKKSIENKINNYSIKYKSDINKEINYFINQESDRQNIAFDKLNDLFKEDDDCLNGLSSQDKEELKTSIGKSIKDNRLDDKQVCLEFEKRIEEFNENKESANIDNGLMGGFLSKIKRLFS